MIFIDYHNVPFTTHDPIYVNPSDNEILDNIITYEEDAQGNVTQIIKPTSFSVPDRSFFYIKGYFHLYPDMPSNLAP